MAERLTVSLEDGSIERLRLLAGGERKVGAYLSGVVSWLWEYREALQAAPLVAYAPVLHEWIPRIAMSPEEQAQALEDTERLRADNKAISARLDAIEAGMQAVLEGRAALLAQEDSSQNDA